MFGIIGAMDEEISALRDAISGREIKKIGPITFYYRPAVRANR
jgi:nucleoside phosphorylase